MNSGLDSELRKLLSEITHSGAPVDPASLAERLFSHGISIPAEQLPELIATILETFHVSHIGHLDVPYALSDVLTKLLEGRSAQTICDPWAWLGKLLVIAQQEIPSANCVAFNINEVEGKLAKVIFPRAEWTIGQPLKLLSQHKDPIDVVVSCPPFGAKTNEILELADKAGNVIMLKGELGHLILTAATACLSEDGIGYFVVSPSFFLSSHSVLKQFPELGFSVEAAFALPAASFAPVTSIITYLLVVKKAAQSKMFVAQASNEGGTNSQILANFENEKEGGTVELGRYVDVFEFRGIDWLRAEYYFESARKQVGFPAVRLEDLALQINLGRSGEDFEFPGAPNAIFVPIIGQSDVVKSVQELTLKPQNYAQIIFDPSKSHASFVAQFLNTELGKKVREWSKSGNAIPRLNQEVLKKLKVFIPDIKVQEQMMNMEARIAYEENALLSLQGDLSELRRELWVSPGAISTYSKQLDEFSTRTLGVFREISSSGLEQWVESTPFPVASILRTWQTASSNDHKAKYEHLLHFFEATAEFVGIVLLSAFSSNEGVYKQHKEKLKASMEKQGLSFKRSTFGTWKLVVEYLGKQTRLLLNEDGKESKEAKSQKVLCAEIFSDSTFRLPEVLSRKDIAAVFSKTNSMRNEWVGHGGAVSRHDAKMRSEALLGELEKLRQAMVDIWDKSTVVKALNCKLQQGVFRNEIALLKGSNIEFIKRVHKLSICLDVDNLYIINGDQSNALKLLPLVRLGVSLGLENNACYFFNSIKQNSVKFVCYHFADPSGFTDKRQDVCEAISLLTEG